jgi:peptidoglycan/LPS O-acetylase OafA/YrhL
MDLLDDVKIEISNKPIFSWIAILMPMIYLGMTYYVGTHVIRDELAVNENLIYILIVSFFIIGVCSSIFSFVRKEKPRFLRYTGGTINLLLVVVIVVSIIYT